MVGKNFGSDDKFVTDEDLIREVRNGSSEAVDLLVTRYSGTVRFISRSYFSEALTSDDWFQEGMLGLLFAIHSYGADDRTASFFTFAATCIKNRLNSAWRSANNCKNAPLNDYLTYDDATVPTVDSPEDSYIENERYRFFTESFLAQLSYTERKVISQYLAGFSYREIAERLHLTEKSVDNALCRAKSKLKKSFEK